MIKTQKRKLAFGLNLVRLYRKLCSGKSAHNTLLLESADVHTRTGQKSFLMAKAALKIRAGRDFVTVDALSPLGELMLKTLVETATLEIQTKNVDRVVFKVPKRNLEESLSDQLHGKSCLDVIRNVIKLHIFATEAKRDNFLTAGILSYDLIDHFEDLPAAKSDINQFPDYLFWFPESFVEVNHVLKTTHIIHHYVADAGTFVDLTAELCESLKDSEPEEAKSENRFDVSDSVKVDMSDDEYEKLVELLKQHVVGGDVFQIVPSRTFSMPCADTLGAYERLKAINPSPYMYYLVDEDFELFGASPETFIKLDAMSHIVDVKPIAGTRRRGRKPDGEIDIELDSRLEAELRLDTKELAEHMMLVDLARNDIARVAKLGTRHLHRLLSVERYSHVMHLVSQVRAELAEDLDGLHAYQASMNMGTLVGAPKIKAAELLRKHEKSKRGPYGGAIGYMDAAGNFDTAIVIRSAYVKNGVAQVRAGAGVVYDSVAKAEAEETRTKASAVLSAIGALR